MLFTCHLTSLRSLLVLYFCGSSLRKKTPLPALNFQGKKPDYLTFCAPLSPTSEGLLSLLRRSECRKGALGYVWCKVWMLYALVTEKSAPEFNLGTRQFYQYLPSCFVLEHGLPDFTERQVKHLGCWDYCWGLEVTMGCVVGTQCHCCIITSLERGERVRACWKNYSRTQVGVRRFCLGIYQSHWLWRDLLFKTLYLQCNWSQLLLS